MEEHVFDEEDGIDPERIIADEYQVAKELLCTICQGLLWKPKSCGSCQHLFCSRCIRTWLQINPTACPFRCSPYEERRSPPHIHSLLARLSIRCRNNVFGCTAILAYDALEQHETIECSFLSKRCAVCQENILIEEINDHERQCQPATVTCSLCQQSIDRNILNQHRGECLRQKVEGFFNEILPLEDNREIVLNNPMMFVQQQMNNNNWFTRFYTQINGWAHRLPQVDLEGFEEVAQAQQRSPWFRIWSIVRLISLNPTRIAQILLPLISFTIGYFVGFLISISLFIQRQVNESIYRSFFLIIFTSGLICFGLHYLLASVKDIWIIGFTLISLILFGASSSHIPLVYLRVHQNTKLLLLLYALGLMTFEAALLLLRLFAWYIPPYLSAGALAWNILFLTFHIRRMSLNQRQIF